MRRHEPDLPDWPGRTRKLEMTTVIDLRPHRHAFVHEMNGGWSWPITGLAPVHKPALQGQRLERCIWLGGFWYGRLAEFDLAVHLPGDPQAHSGESLDDHLL